MVNRINSPDERRDLKGNIITILPGGTLLKDRYEVSYLTAGGMGVIYKAMDRNTDLPCIVKEIIFKSEDNESLKMKSFIREKEMLSTFYHPGIVNLLDYFQEDNAYYLVLEAVEGSPLDEHVKKNKPSINKIIFWSLQLCNVLEYLHNMSPPVIYRDLKPENILIDKNDRLKLIDFGIARTYKEEQEKDTEPVGSPGFASPEQYGRKQTDNRSDIYSMGALIHYLITGLDPREKEKPFVFEAPGKYNPKVPSSLEEIVIRALNLPPENRFQNIEEVKKLFEDLSEAYTYERTLPPDDVVEKEFKRAPGYFKRTLLFSLSDIVFLLLVFILLIPVAVSGPDKMRGSASEGCQRLSNCERNMSCYIAPALELYLEDYGEYPPDLNCLIKGGYLERLPVCTYSKREYVYELNPGPAWFEVSLESSEWIKENFHKEFPVSMVNKKLSPEELEEALKKEGFTEKEIKEISSQTGDPYNTDKYRLWCPLPASHVPSGRVPEKGCYPQYSPSLGTTMKSPERTGVY